MSPYDRTRGTAVPLVAQSPDVLVEEWPVQEFTYLEPGRFAGTTGAERRTHVDYYWKTRAPEYRDGPGAESFSDLIRSLSRECFQRPRIVTNGNVGRRLGLSSTRHYP